jgi:co-chaperonin GroES (HSP10)
MIQVILNRVLVRPQELVKNHKVEGTEISIIIEHGKTEAQHEAARVEGTVVAIGPTAYADLTDNPPIKEGDHVVFARYSGVFVTDPETKETLVVLNDTDVLCVVR